MAFDRSKFKAAKVEVNKQVTRDVEKTLSTGDSTRGDYHSIDEGINVFRMMPPHNENEPSMQPKAVYWLMCKTPKTDSEGKPIDGEYSWVRRPIFDSRIHGSTPKDIIDEYIKFTKKIIFDTTADKEQARKLLAPINGWRGKDGKWNQGILISTSYVCYATKGDITPENLGRLEMYENDKKALEKLNIDEESGEVIQTDIFSDPDEGCQFILHHRKNDKDKWENVISKKTYTPKPGTRDYNAAIAEFLESQKVPDAVLEKLSTMESLAEQFQDSYRKTDFIRAVEALQKFDLDNGYHTFENDEFLEILQEISDYYPEEEATQVEEYSNPTTVEEEASLDDMTRDELKAYIKANKLPIKVLNSMSDDIIRQMIVEAESEEETTDEPEEASVEADPLPWEGEAEPAASEPAQSAAEKLRSRLRSIKK